LGIEQVHGESSGSRCNTTYLLALHLPESQGLDHATGEICAGVRGSAGCNTIAHWVNLPDLTAPARTFAR
jgi:hypothetical protein